MVFDSLYIRDSNPSLSHQDIVSLASLERYAIGLTSFLAIHAGGSYSDGLYRIHSVATMPKWTGIAEETFPDFRSRIFCFGVDWLGRMFALDFARKNNGQYLVLMLEPGTGQALEIPVAFMEFHDQELVKYQDEALAVKFFDEWRHAGGESPQFDQCVGYKKPLFLNGSDNVENLELTDMEVYWSITGQLLSKLRRLPDGTRIEGARLKD
jgi:hypothetical protein